MYVYRCTYLPDIVKFWSKQLNPCVDPVGVNSIEMECIPSDKPSNLSPESPNIYNIKKWI